MNTSCGAVLSSTITNVATTSSCRNSAPRLDSFLPRQDRGLQSAAAAAPDTQQTQISGFVAIALETVATLHLTKIMSPQILLIRQRVFGFVTAVGIAQ
jgi:hypothetical protein